ncbi:MAG: hypothetical protein LUH21_16240 [Clostridiales bacterium]|nr:hypothetical protein [Clostridiales bacterium]
MGRNADGSWFVMGGYKVSQLTPEDKGLLRDFWGKKGPGTVLGRERGSAGGAAQEAGKAVMKTE